MTFEEIRLVVAIVLALLVGVVTKSYRDRQRLAHPPPPVAGQEDQRGPRPMNAPRELKVQK